MLVKEIKHQVEILNLKSTAKDKGTNIVIGLARTSIPIEIRAKYIRDEDYSIVIAVVKVESDAEYYSIEAEVKITIFYEGDMVRSSSAMRNEINNRLEFLAQKVCAEHVKEELVRIEK